MLQGKSIYEISIYTLYMSSFIHHGTKDSQLVSRCVQPSSTGVDTAPGR